MEIKKDIKEEITNKFIECLEKNLRPWNSNVIFKQPQNAETKQFYNGINKLYLNLISNCNNYKSNKWVSFNQAKALGGNIKKGEKGTHIVFYKTFEDEEKNNLDDKKTKTISIMKHYSIFNLDQCENIEINEEIQEEFSDTSVDDFINKLDLNIQYNNCKNASYNILKDEIIMPLHFHNKNAKYSTLLHELLHWTGHENRLNRLKKIEKYGSESYAFEELIAEIGSTFLSAHFKLNIEYENHASYVKSWIKILKNDKKAIFEAAAKAQEAFNFIFNKASEIDKKLIA